jgi:hypothetical protein
LKPQSHKKKEKKKLSLTKIVFKPPVVPQGDIHVRQVYPYALSNCGVAYLNPCKPKWQVWAPGGASVRLTPCGQPKEMKVRVTAIWSHWGSLTWE